MWTLLFLGCSGGLDLDMTPESLDLGTIDFAVEMPEEGYNPLPVTVRNLGKVDTVLSIVGDDPDHLCVQGFPDRVAPYDLGSLPAGASYTFEVAACGALPGDMDTDVITGLVIGAEGAPAPMELSVTFFSTRTIDDGTN